MLTFTEAIGFHQKSIQSQLEASSFIHYVIFVKGIDQKKKILQKIPIIDQTLYDNLTIKQYH